MSFVERSLNASFLCKIIYVRKHANKVLLSSRHKRLFEHSRFPARNFFFHQIQNQTEMFVTVRARQVLLHANPAKSWSQ